MARYRRRETVVQQRLFSLSANEKRRGAGMSATVWVSHNAPTRNDAVMPFGSRALSPCIVTIASIARRSRPITVSETRIRRAVYDL